MTWGLASSSFSTARPSFTRFSNRGQDFSYSSPGWSSGPASSGGWKSGWKGSKGASNAAVSALALLSFLFFLNMLQQNLSSGQQQTLLFTVNSTRNRINRRVRRPLIAVAQVQAKHGADGRPKLDVKPTNNAKILVREERDVSEAVSENNIGPDKLHPPVMMEGLAQGGALQLGAWLQGQIGAEELRTDLLDTLTNCRAVVACNLHREKAGQRVPAEVVRRLLIEAGEYAEESEQNLDQVCNDLTLAAGEECSTLAQSFANLLPPPATHQRSKDSDL